MQGSKSAHKVCIVPATLSCPPIIRYFERYNKMMESLRPMKFGSNSENGKKKSTKNKTKNTVFEFKF